MTRPKSIPRALVGMAPDREVERFFRETADKVLDGDVSIDELAQIFLTLQRNTTAQLEYRIAQLERKLADLSETDYRKEIDDTRRLAWLLPRKS